MSAPVKTALRVRVRTPELGVRWESRGERLRTNLRALFTGPRAGKLPRRARFHDTWRAGESRWAGFGSSFAIHAAWMALVNPVLWTTSHDTYRRPLSERVELTYYRPARDLPPLLPLAPKAKAPAREPSRPPPAPEPPAQLRIDRPARQTILSTPAVPNHPRQTLIQPLAPPEAPKILPQLPNIVQWTAPSVPRPRVQISREALARLRPRLRRARAQIPEAQLPLPTAPNAETLASDMSIPVSAAVILKPRLRIAATTVAARGARRVVGEALAAPEVGGPAGGMVDGDPGVRLVIALSAMPAPPEPAFEIPLGNVAARIAMSPLGAQPGLLSGGVTSGGSPNGGTPGINGSGAGSGPNGGGGGGGSGPPGILISGGDPSNTANVAGPGSPGSAPPAPLPARPEARPSPPLRGLNLGRPGALIPPTRESASMGDFSPASPEAVLRSKRIYTVYVNMPNLASVTGSWIVRFAELNGEKVDPGAPMLSDLSSPQPLRKVDPHYPPALVSARIQGEVVLYAIIRRDGSVDSVQLLKKLEPQLDRNAVEAFSRWQFRPAERNGDPVEIEAVITIPFRAVAPL